MSIETPRLPAAADPSRPRLSVEDRAARIGHAFSFLLVGLPIAAVSFSLLLAGLCLSLSLLVLVVGIPIAAGTLGVAHLFAAAERAHLRMVGVDIPPPAPLAPARGFRGWWAWLRNPQLWLDFLHGLLIFPIAVATFCLAVSWLAGALGGLTFWFWSQWLPKRHPGDRTLPQMLHWPISERMLDLIFGAVLLITWPAVVRLCAAVHIGLGRSMLGSEHIRALQERVVALTASRAAVVAAEADALRGLERDIHDGPQQRLVRLGMDLSVAERRLDDDPQAVRTLLAQARTQTAEALAELRALSRGIAPPILSDRGLGAALAGVVARSPVPTDLDLSGLDGARPAAAVESTAYFVVTEALANVAKHSQARGAHVLVRRGRRRLLVEIEDDGVGGAHIGKGQGLAGLSGRLAAVDGRFAVVSPVGGPTVIRAEIPCG